MTKLRITIITKIYKDNIWKIYSIPKKILSNRESQFVLEFIEDLSKVLEIKQTLSTVYHSQTDGQIKRINQEVEAFSWHYVNYQQNNWTEQLSVVEFWYNNKKTLSYGICAI